jgi:MFS family permease
VPRHHHMRTYRGIRSGRSPRARPAWCTSEYRSSTNLCLGYCFDRVCEPEPFFFASAAASSAYLTASEIFPLETRALAIACFYALGTAIGGSTSPLLFGWLIESGSAWRVSAGYALAAALLLIAAGTELVLGINAEGKSLESIADPLSS